MDQLNTPKLLRKTIGDASIILSQTGVVISPAIVVEPPPFNPTILDIGVDTLFGIAGWRAEADLSDLAEACERSLTVTNPLTYPINVYFVSTINLLIPGDKLYDILHPKDKGEYAGVTVCPARNRMEPANWWPACAVAASYASQANAIAHELGHYLLNTDSQRRDHNVRDERYLMNARALEYSRFVPLDKGLRMRMFH